jgi:hypothetical protein
MKNFLSNANANNQLSNENSIVSFSNASSNLNNLIFQCFLKTKTSFLKEKTFVRFPKRTLTMPMRAHKIKPTNKQITQSTLSMKEKIKSKPM